MILLKDFKTFKDLAATYGVMTSIYDDIVVDTMNTLSLLDSMDKGQLYSLANTWIQIGDSAQQEIGQLLKNLASANRGEREEILLTRNGYKSILYCLGKLLDSETGSILKNSSIANQSGLNMGLAIYSVSTSALNILMGQESYADKYQNLENSTDIVNTAWNDFRIRRAEYRFNPSEENFDAVIYSCMNYLQSAAVSETTFVDLVNEARQHIVLQFVGYGQPMVEAAQHSQDHVAALSTFVSSIRQCHKNWKAITNYDYSIVKSQSSNALSTYKTWSYESYSNH